MHNTSPSRARAQCTPVKFAPVLAKPPLPCHIATLANTQNQIFPLLVADPSLRSDYPITDVILSLVFALQIVFAIWSFNDASNYSIIEFIDQRRYNRSAALSFRRYVYSENFAMFRLRVSIEITFLCIIHGTNCFVKLFSTKTLDKHEKQLTSYHGPAKGQRKCD